MSAANLTQQVETGSRMLTPTSRATAALANNEATFDTQRVRRRLLAAQRLQEFKELEKELPQLADIADEEEPADTGAPMGGGGGGGGSQISKATAKKQQAKVEKRARWRGIVIIAAIALVLWYVLRNK